MSHPCVQICTGAGSPYSPCWPVPAQPQSPRRRKRGRRWTSGRPPSARVRRDSTIRRSAHQCGSAIRPDSTCASSPAFRRSRTGRRGSMTMLCAFDRRTGQAEVVEAPTDAVLTALPSAPSIEGIVWRAEDIGGGGIIDRSRATLTFGADGRISGSASCNHYSGSLRPRSGRLELHVGTGRDAEGLRAVADGPGASLPRDPRRCTPNRTVADGCVALVDTGRKVAAVLP